MLKSSFISELDKYIITHGSISYFEKNKENNQVDLAKPCNKLEFNIQKMFRKNKLNWNLLKLAVNLV